MIAKLTNNSQPSLILGIWKCETQSLSIMIDVLRLLKCEPACNSAKHLSRLRRCRSLQI